MWIGIVEVPSRLEYDESCSSADTGRQAGLYTYDRHSLGALPKKSPTTFPRPHPKRTVDHLVCSIPTRTQPFQLCIRLTQGEYPCCSPLKQELMIPRRYTAFPCCRSGIATELTLRQARGYRSLNLVFLCRLYGLVLGDIRDCSCRIRERYRKQQRGNMGSVAPVYPALYYGLPVLCSYGF
jgi:hypothetical protein